MLYSTIKYNALMLKYFSRSLVMYKKFGLFMSFGVFINASDFISSRDNTGFWIWVAMFTLGLIGIIILFLSSRQMSKIKDMHNRVLNKQLEMEKNQALILTTMSENIHNMAKEALQSVDKGKKNSTVSIDTVDVEEALFDVTNDLIEFLRLKSRKVEIVNEEFNLNNVLNEVSGTVCSHFKGSNVELIFDINNTVPRLFVGDSLHLGKIINNILENRLASLNNEELRLEINVYNTFDDKVELQLQFIDTGVGMTQDEVDTLFIPYYDEESGQYTGLGLFVAQELVRMMNGEISIHSHTGKGTSFTLTIPLDIVDPQNKRRYRLPEKILTDKKVLIVDENYNSALAIKKMFAYFKHDVKILSKEKFIEAMPNFTAFDIVVLDEELFSIRTIEYAKEIQEKHDIKIVSLTSLLKMNENNQSIDIVDRQMFKPLTQERIFEMIINMYELKVAPIFEDSLDENTKAKIYTSTILETHNVNQNSFSVFKNKKLLIVEDNIINQKVLTNILNHSGMQISLANNGLEAVELIESNRENAFDMVLMDINMPVMDGYAATQKIRLNTKYDSIPVVAFTALVLDSEIEKMFNSGVNAFLAKPLNIGKLYTALSMFLLDKPNKYMQEEEISSAEEVNISVLCVKTGIRHSGESKALYMEVLAEFVEAYQDSDVIFKKLIEEHRFEQLKMLCLDMKGLSGTIGANEMSAEIAEVQKLLLYKKNEELPSHIGRYGQGLKTLIDNIKIYLEDNV